MLCLIEIILVRKIFFFLFVTIRWQISASFAAKKEKKKKKDVGLKHYKQQFRLENYKIWQKRLCLINSVRHTFE